MQETRQQLRARFEGIHAAGVKRHPGSWFTANHAALTAAMRSDFDKSDLRVATLMSDIVLRVLDVVECVPTGATIAPSE